MNTNNYSVEVGKIIIYLPDFSTNLFGIFQDLTTILKKETNFDCEKLIKDVFQNIKLKTDSESDNTLIQTKDPKNIVEIAVYLNKFAGIEFSSKEISEIRGILQNWKKPKKQKWEEGDIFSIPLNNDKYAFGQIIENYYGLPICLLFKGIFNGIPNGKVILKQEPLAILMITIDDIVTHNYKVLFNHSPVLTVPIPKRRDKIRTITYASDSLIKISEGYAKLTNWDSDFDSTLVENISIQ